MIDLAALTPYIFAAGFAWVAMIIAALLLAPTWEHLKWKRRQGRRSYR